MDAIVVPHSPIAQFAHGAAGTHTQGEGGEKKGGGGRKDGRTTRELSYSFLRAAFATGGKGRKESEKERKGGRGRREASIRHRPPPCASAPAPCMGEKGKEGGAGNILPSSEKRGGEGEGGLT